MFSQNDDTKRKTQEIADYLSNHKQFNSHTADISEMTYIEIDQQFLDLVLSVYHATSHTFTGGTGIVSCDPLICG